MMIMGHAAAYYGEITRPEIELRLEERYLETERRVYYVYVICYVCTTMYM